MGVKEELKADVTEAMRSGDSEKRDTLRMLLAAIKQEEVDQRRTLNDDEIVDVLAKQAKQRRESIADAEKAGRTDLAVQEKAELAIIQAYLPQMMSEKEIRVLAEQSILETGATGPQDMGKVMGNIMPKVKGSADGKLVSKLVRELLQN